MSPTYVRLVLVRHWVGLIIRFNLLLILKLVEPAPHFDLTFSVPLLSSVNWRGFRDALSSIRLGPIFKSHSKIEDLDNQLSEVLLQFLPMVTVRRRSGDSPWFDEEYRIAFDRKRSAYRRWSGSQSNGIARSEAETCYASVKTRYSERCVARE